MSEYEREHFVLQAEDGGHAGMLIPLYLLWLWLFINTLAQECHLSSTTSTRLMMASSSSTTGNYNSKLIYSWILMGWDLWQW